MIWLCFRVGSGPRLALTKENHWGHRNVIFKDIQNLPARPIGARTPGSGLGSL